MNDTIGIQYTTRKNRNSNIEILRIISIIFIVLHHICYHGEVYLNSTGFLLYFSLIFIPFGKIFFVVFTSISCYFLITQKFKSKRFFIIWFETLFYNLLILLIDILYFKDSLPVSDIIRSFLPIFGMGVSHGYVSGFLLFLLIVPFLKLILMKINSLGAVVLFAILFLVNIYTVVVGASNIGTSLLSFINIFLFISIYLNTVFYKKLNFKKTKYIYLFITLLIYALYYFLFYMSKIQDNSICNLSYKLLLYDERSPLIILAGSSIFFFVNSIKPKSYKCINYISGCTLDILLIHDSGLIRKHIWIDIFKASDYYNNSFYLWMNIVALVICITGFVLYLFRKFLFEKILFKISVVKDLCFKVDNFYLTNIENFETRDVENEKESS